MGKRIFSWNFHSELTEVKIIGEKFLVTHFPFIPYSLLKKRKLTYSSLKLFHSYIFVHVHCILYSRSRLCIYSAYPMYTYLYFTGDGVNSEEIGIVWLKALRFRGKLRMKNSWIKVLFLYFFFSLFQIPYIWVRRKESYQNIEFHCFAFFVYFCPVIFHMSSLCTAQASSNARVYYGF